MSYKHESWAWHIPVSGTEKLVLVCLAFHANKNSGRAFPSRDTLVEMTGLSRATVYRAIRSLEDSGHLLRHSARGWQFTAEQMSHCATPDSQCETEKSHCETETSHCETHNSKELSVIPNEYKTSASAGDAAMVEKMKPGSVQDMLKFVDGRAIGHKQKKLNQTGKAAVGYKWQSLLHEHHSVPKVPLVGKDYGMLTTFVSKVGADNADAVMQAVVEHWDDFRVYLKSQTGTAYDAQVPQLGVLVTRASFALKFTEDRDKAQAVVVSTPVTVKTTKKTMDIVVDDDPISFEE